LVQLGAGSARVALDAIDSMAVDAHGLIHGGFVFDLADYAAMLAVNDPNVVLAAADTRFVKPVRRGDHVVASAYVVGAHDRKREVRVEATVGLEKVFEGTLTCFVPGQHVLGKVGNK